VTDSQENSVKAFHWIIDLMERHRVPFQITGGLAAWVYGSDRELADIDVDVPEEWIPKLFPFVNRYVEFGPRPFKDEYWELDLMRLKYQGQPIDLGGAYRAKVFDKTLQQWVAVPADFSKAEHRSIFGRIVPIVARELLLDYKRKLGREVDLLDIAHLEGN
jgi:hypothetical protein